MGNESPCVYPPNYGSNDREPLHPTAPPPPYDPGYQQQPYPPPLSGTGTPPARINYLVQPNSTIIVPQNLRSTSQFLICPSCTAQITTTVSYDSGLLVWLACVGLIFIGLGWGCCFIPFFINSCKDATHTCPNCGAFIGRYKPL